MTILGYVILGWLGVSAVAALGWVTFVEVCRYQRPNRAERWEPARHQSGSVPHALRPGAARATAQRARTEPDPTVRP